MARLLCGLSGPLLFVDELTSFLFALDDAEPGPRLPARWTVPMITAGAEGPASLILVP